MKEIVDAIRNNCCVIFAGAGISKTAGLPDWIGLADKLYRKLLDRGRIRAPYKDVIADLLAKDDSINHVLPIMEMILQGARRIDVAGELREILTPGKESEVHALLKKLNICGYITTNYDRLLDNIISSNAYRLTNSFTSLKIVPTAVQSSNQFLIKLHGDIDDVLPPDDPKVAEGGPFMVISQADYAALVQGERGRNLMLALHSILQKSSILFLGYSFTDPDIAHALRYLEANCTFSQPSWFVGLKSDKISHLPRNVTVMQPLGNWNDLPSWLSTITSAVGKNVATLPARQVQQFSADDKRALKSIGEYIYGLETEDLCEKVLSSILISELLNRDTVTIEWISRYIEKFLQIGPVWATAFARLTARQLNQFGIATKIDDSNYRISKTKITSLQRRVASDYEGERVSFFDSVTRRLSRSGIPFSSEFSENLDATFQDLCLNYGQQMAEWFHRGVGKEFGNKYIEEISSYYFKNPDDHRKAAELIQLIFEEPSEQEVPYIYRLLSSAFLLNSVQLDPTASKFLKEYAALYELYLDSNVLLPLLIKEHKNHSWIASIISASKNVGADLFVVDNIFGEVLGHKEVAQRIWETYPDFESLTVYTDPMGLRANCFVQGYLNAAGKVPAKALSWREYMARYTDSKLKDFLHETGIRFTPVKIEDKLLYSQVLGTIREEWLKRHAMERHDKLNEHDASQFLHIYKRRRDLVESGKKDEVWFLSYETVLEKVYLRNPQAWGKPPTFPVSAWASFLDFRMVSEHKDRKNILDAILKGNSTAYDLPDTRTIVRKKVFGNDVLTDAQDEALSIAMSDEPLVSRFEKARSNIISRASKPHRPGDDTTEATVNEYKEATHEVKREIIKELNDKIELLKSQLSRNKDLSSAEIDKLLKEIEQLKTSKKRRRRHGSK